MNNMHVCREALRRRAPQQLTPFDLDQATCVDGTHTLARATRKKINSDTFYLFIRLNWGKRSVLSAMRFVIRSSEHVFYLMLAFTDLFCWFVAGFYLYMSKNGVESIISSELITYGFIGMVDPLAFIIGLTITYILWLSFRIMRNNPDKFGWLAT